MDKNQGQPIKSKNIISRLKTTSIAVPTLILIFTNQYSLLALLIAVSYIGYDEFDNIKDKTLEVVFNDEVTKMLWEKKNRFCFTKVLLMLCPLIFFLYDDLELITLLITVIFTTANKLFHFIRIYNTTITEILKKKEPQEAENIKSKIFVASLISLCYDYILFIFFIYPINFIQYVIRFRGGPIFVMQWMWICYLCDAGGLIFGVKFGKTNFGAPITPSKTREGMIGCFLIGMFAGLISNWLLQIFFPNAAYMDFGPYLCHLFCVVLSALFGDFFESFFKRCGNVKDSGTIFPGHGGILDRIDSITLAAPVTFLFLKYFSK